ncbi:NUDIX domain-containing protein [Amycolatopsis acidiphila]|uniref:NUDIX domain-containing protein n=1 Tax=Amycolatopsis acidiphila TaxID=715473 RepID=A0A557ZUQ5_9PSEU|nr:NUDIX domain-containing protein [Amycolatopsis acidiphila]TVT15752.1 NUDIX domain-containing protein [Amycolatopsis acidiphila]UIJ56858.1 NUDIX domain-containing protein [Amycolatopsis acidiphila]GHG54734.1 NUDIX hydrolase [Amycolatopsis acidiphila]
MTVAELLAGYRPRTATEAADVARVRTLAGSAADPWRRVHPLHVTASAFVVHPGTGRVLLRWHPRQRGWLQVGGHGDPGEREPIAVALREGREETGLADLVPWPDASLLQVVVVPVAAKGDEPAHEHADLRFVLATGEPDAVRPERPDAPLRWLTVAEARAGATEDNVREALSRLAELITGAGPVSARTP